MKSELKFRNRQIRIESSHLLRFFPNGNPCENFPLKKNKEERLEINMNRDSSLKATSKFSEQSQLPVINGKGNGQLMYKKKGSKKTQHDSSVKNGKPSSVFKRRIFCFSKSFSENRVSC